MKVAARAKIGTMILISLNVNPPIRDKSHYDRLWYAVKNNLNDTIGSDHAPHLKVNKDKEYPNSPSGMPGVQTLMPVMLNHVNDGKLSLTQLINLVCENPVKIFGIQNKGFIRKDYDADFTIVDVDVLNANPKAILNGKVLQTIVNGKVKYDAGLLD